MHATVERFAEGTMNHYKLVAGAFAAALLLTCGCRPASNTKSATAITPAVSVSQPVSRKVNEWDEFTGRLASPETVEVRARVSGYIDKVHFKEGSEVKQGDLLVTIDQRPYQAVVDRLKAEVGAARARAELARGEAKRAEGLAATKAISTDTYEQRRQTAVQADESVLSAEAALKAAQLDIEFTEVRAPITGRISNARVTAGNLVVGGSTANASLLTTIVSLDPLYCYFEADEASVLRYRQLHREGKRIAAMFAPVPAEMELGNEQGFPHKGQIDFVDNQVNPATGTIRARAVFPNLDKLMAPGFFARVRIPGAGEYDAVLIRDTAVSSDQGRLFVLTVDAQNKTIYRPIKIGPIVDGLRVVREGLSANDRVIVSGLMSARPGMTVQPQEVPMTTNNAVATATATASKP
jgi:RND family efflux transporter MFP subunit